jgi:oxygen-independent coproporphyrinogen-3 oxidase
MYSTEIDTKSIYLHWPFCPYKCHFCPFVAVAGKDTYMDRYHATLVREIMRFTEKCNQKYTLDTIYFGGGTPSTYPNELLLDMFAILKTVFTFSSQTEITLEVNPGTVDDTKLKVWNQVGINRLSIGVQSLKDGVLSDLNRHQSINDVMWLMNRVGMLFNNVSVDIILGLPGVSDPDWRELLATIVTWPITHISMYILEIHEGTALHFRVKTKKTQLPDDDHLTDVYEWSINFLEQAGFMQYEVSSFAKNGYQSRHNVGYWDRKPYKGFGIGACSFDGTTRFQNYADLHHYIDAQPADYDALCTREQLTRKQIINEKIMLGVRRSTGLMLAEIYEHMSHIERAEMATTIRELQASGFITESHEKIILTPRGLLIENTIATRLSLL